MHLGPVWIGHWGWKLQASGLEKMPEREAKVKLFTKTPNAMRMEGTEAVKCIENDIGHQLL